MHISSIIHRTLPCIQFLGNMAYLNLQKLQARSALYCPRGSLWFTAWKSNQIMEGNRGNSLETSVRSRSHLSGCWVASKITLQRTPPLLSLRGFHSFIQSSFYCHIFAPFHSRRPTRHLCTPVVTPIKREKRRLRTNLLKKLFSQVRKVRKHK